MILLMNARREVIVIRKKIAVKNPVLKNGVHYMTSDYKTRNSGRNSHSGIDMIGKNYAADYIISIDDGVVKSTGYSKNGSGYYVYVSHGDYLVIYAHMKKGSIVVKKGQRIKKGQVIGYMGTTGNSTGVHLHISIKHNNVLVDPLPFLQGKSFDDNIRYVYNCDNLNVRSGPSVKYKLLNDLPKNTKVKVLSLKNGWAKISENSYVANNYLTSSRPPFVYESGNVNADNLNVRYGPGTNYNLWSEKSPLPRKTVVAIVKKDKWIKISEIKNRWVSSNFIK